MINNLATLTFRKNVKNNSEKRKILRFYLLI